MPETWRYRGQTINREQVVFLREFIAADWKQANGTLRDVVCRGLLLLLERAGEISLPPVRRHISGQCRNARLRPEPLPIDTTPLAMPLAALGRIEIQLVRRTVDEPLFNSLMEQYHYLGYEQPVGEHLKYLVWERGTAAQARPVAALAWSSSPRHIGARDRYIGWDQPARQRNLHLIAYNTRFLILPWVKVPHLASHILGRMASRLSTDWEALYAHPIYLLETFVDPERFRGTCYLAANWKVLGETTGRGKADLTHRPNRSIKQVLALPLHRRFRERLSGVAR
jgi:hypothetical protein